MIKTIDLGRDLAGLITLEGRGPHTTEEEAQKSFMKLADFRDGALFAASFSGSSGWERHRKGDEIVQMHRRVDPPRHHRRRRTRVAPPLRRDAPGGAAGLLAPVLLGRRRQGADRDPAAHRASARRRPENDAGVGLTEFRSVPDASLRALHTRVRIRHRHCHAGSGPDAWFTILHRMGDAIAGCLDGTWRSGGRRGPERASAPLATRPPSPRPSLCSLVFSQPTRPANGKRTSAERSNEQRARSERRILVGSTRSPSLRGDCAPGRESGLYRARSAAHPGAAAGARDHLAESPATGGIRNPRSALRRRTFPGTAHGLPSARVPAYARPRASTVVPERVHRLHASRTSRCGAVSPLHLVRQRGGTQRCPHRTSDRA